MTVERAPVSASRGTPGGAKPRSAATMPVDILICGSRDRHDDGAALAAASLLERQLPPRTRLRSVGQLDIDDLLAVPAGGGVVIVDAATGLRSGEIVVLPLDGLLGRDDVPRPRSSHALEFREVIGVATLVRRFPLPGRIVAIGGRRWGLGVGLSPRVGRAIPALARATLDAVELVRS